VSAANWEASQLKRATEVASTGRSVNTAVGDRRYDAFVIPSEAEASLTIFMPNDSNCRLTNCLPLAREWATSTVKSSPDAHCNPKQNSNRETRSPGNRSQQN